MLDGTDFIAHGVPALGRALGAGAERELLGRAIGLCRKEKIFKEYIAMELSLGEIDRCRALYNNYLKAIPEPINRLKELDHDVFIVTRIQFRLYR